MSLALLATLVLSALGLGYLFYGRLIARELSLSQTAPTPAETLKDGVDYVPTKPFYLLGQHFSAIAAAGPIAGPILACQTFGWLPCILWISLGVVFIGAVHDFSALVASVRHEAQSIAEIVKQNIGRRAWLALLAFIWIALVYVIVAFADITAGTFVGKTEELEGGMFPFNKGGAVAAASTMYLLLAVVMGFVQKRFNPPLGFLTLVFVPATLAVVWLGTKLSTLLILDQQTWGLVILVYCFVASLLPVWILLQPRGYLGGFVLYLALAIGVVGVFFGPYTIEQPALRSLENPKVTDVLFPFLFVTIACGACSGFHGLVCSGTTSKQIAKETHCRPVGYGGMLLEGFVALIALATIMVVAQPQGAPGRIYGDGIGRFLSLLIGEENLLFATTFGAMAFSTFVFDTLDVATRLGRYVLQELFGRRDFALGCMATLVTVGVPAIFILGAEAGSYRLFWTLFGTSNQLLAALTLLGITVWLYKQGRRYWYTLLPMLFVMTITLWSLGILAVDGLKKLGGSGTVIPALNGGVAICFIVLAAMLLVESVRAVLKLQSR